MSNIFLFHSDAEGESTDSGHNGWIDVNYVKWGNTRRITSNTSTQGDRESSNTIISDLTIFRQADKATPKLFLLACCGTGSEIKVHFTKTGTGQGADVFMEYVLKNAIVSEYSIAAKAQGRFRPTERLTISFVGLEKKYTPFDENGNAQAPLAVGFDTATNTVL